MPTTIEQLELEVQSSSTSAVAGIDALSASLSKLKNAVRGGVGLTSVANQVRNLDTALKSMDSSGADKIDKLASSLEKLKGLGSLKISSSIGNQLQNIGSAAASLTGVDFSAMEKLGTALQPLNNLNASGLKSTINALNKLPKLADTLDNMDMTKFTSQIQQLSTALAPLTNQLNAVTAAFNRLPIRHDVLLKLFEQYVDDEHALWLLRKTVERSRIDVSYMSDEEYEHCLDRLFDSLLYQYMNPKLFTGEKFMGKHLNIGDQVAQTAGISYRIRIDNYVKIVRGVKFYAGYMDDSYAIHESKEFLQELLEDIIEIANELGITVNTRKTRICKLSEHWRFLQVQYSLTDTGRVIQKINPKRLTAMRRRMKKLAPKLTEKEFTDFYKSWFKNHYKIMSKKQRSNMDTLFNQLKVTAP